MGELIQEMTHEDWQVILIYLMRANELKARIDREVQVGSTTSVPTHDPYVTEFREAAEDISDATWLRFGFFAGREAR